MSLNPRAGTCVGVLFGLSHIQLIVADVSHQVIADEAVVLDPDYTPEHAAQLARKLIRDAYAQHGISRDTLLGVGVAVAGPVNPHDGRVLRASGVPMWPVLANGARAIAAYGLAGLASWLAARWAGGPLWQQLAAGTLAMAVTTALLAVLWPAFRRDIASILHTRHLIAEARSHR